MELFDNWFMSATDSGILLPEAMTLSTATQDGRPSSRMVLLKAFGPEGFVFYTNYGSRKATELDDNPYGSLLFHWSVLQRQIRIEGKVRRIGAEESSVYFASRGRGSKIGAWASPQSERIESRTALETRYSEVEKRFEGEEVPRPDFWGGYRLAPTSLEFWQGRINRLHDRVLFERDGETWRAMRLSP